jgi:hypothetical protein
MMSCYKEATQCQQEHMSQKFEVLNWVQEIEGMEVVVLVGLSQL